MSNYPGHPGKSLEFSPGGQWQPTQSACSENRVIAGRSAKWITMGPGRSQWLQCFTSSLPVVKSNMNKGIIFVATLLATLPIHQEDRCLFLCFIYSFKKYQLYFVLGARDTAVNTTEEAPAL